ncbi:MAG TPA: DUF6883 domain-containing protein, partial [Candidatus Wunengus sp. YC64]|uniref:DUF6883 domain-containing protein n=1 Tax=Candidatus Wunengus sp. YC64 TaxID=3367700 RepID=UPI004029BC9F
VIHYMVKLIRNFNLALMGDRGRHGATYNVTKVVESEYGTRYSVDGLLETPDSRNPYVRTVWIIEKQSTTPRLITAHPK